MSASDKIFIEVWNRLTNDWSRLTTFRQMGVLGEDAAREAIHKNNTYFVQQQLLYGEYSKLLKDPEAFIQAGLADRMPQAMTENAVKNFQRTLYASTLVFAHSILDAAVFDCVRICAITAPNDWSKLLANRKVSMEEVASKPYTEILNGLIEVDVARIEKESLLAKVDKVFQICQPTKLEYLTNGFRFDRDRLSGLDELRHMVVHKPSDNRTFENIYEDLQFMQSSGLHIFSLVGEKFNLCFSGKEAIEALAAKQPSAK